MASNNHAPWDLADLSLRLHELAIHTGDLKHSCLGCGHEHNCGVHGCAVLLAAEDAVVKLKAYEDLGLEPEEYKRALSADIMVRVAAGALGVPAERLRELAEADKGGRVVVLPCKPGDTVYMISWRLNGRHEIEERVFSLTYFDPAKYGKDYFLSREEAEEALEAMKDG